MVARIHIYAGDGLNPISNGYQQQGDFVLETTPAKAAKSTTQLGAIWQMIIGFSYRKWILKTTIITCHIAPGRKEAVPMII